MNQSLGQLQTLPHAGRIGLNQPVTGFSQTNIEENFMGSFHCFLAGHA